MLLTYVVFGYFTAATVPGLGCRPREYKAPDGQCCPMCQEGTVVRRDCTAQSGTGCRPCGDNTYMNHPNGLDKCIPCTLCDQGHGLFVLKVCTATSDTVCSVLSGFFCKSVTEGTGCSLAEEHTRCTAGQWTKEPGTNTSDTVCEACQQGTFSEDGVSCRTWTRCPETQVKSREGNATSDIVCSAASRHHYILIFVFISALMCAIAAFKVHPTSNTE